MQCRSIYLYACVCIVPPWYYVHVHVQQGGVQHAWCDLGINAFGDRK